MVLDSKIQAVRDLYGIQRLTDWGQISPEEVKAIPNVGQVTLDHIRLYLAGHNVTLRNDRTPEHWREHLRHIKMAQQVSDDDRAIACPFVILVDTAEDKPFTFAGMTTDADQGYRPMIVTTERRSLGRHPNQLGDYTVDGYFGQIAVERKSITDYQATLLDFGGGRDRFERELFNLSRVKSSMVVVEGSLAAVLSHEEKRRKTPHGIIRKQLFRSTLALLQDYKVPILFCDSRQMAEVATFRFLERHYRKHNERRKAANKVLADL